MRTLPRLLAPALLLALAATLAAQTADTQRVVELNLRAAPPVGLKTAPAADQLDYVFYASDRPVLIRLHLRVGDRPYTAAWEDFTDKVFAWFDKNKAGSLDAAAVARLPQPQSLQFIIRGSIGGGRGGPAVTMAALDRNKDGKVSREEFRAYYRNGGIRPLQFSNNNFEATTATRINQALYKRLDRDGDGKLSKEELARLPGLIARLDENEDELLTTTEISPQDNSGMYGFVAPPRRMPGPPGPQPETGLIEVPPGPARAALAAQLLTRYDRNKDGKVSRAELGLDSAAFDRLDANKDAALDSGELVRFFDRPPDLTFRARVGKSGTVANLLSSVGVGRALVRPRAEVLAPKQGLAGVVKRLDTDTLTFGLGDTRFSLQATEGQQNYFQGVRQFYLQQFDAMAEKKGYVDRSQEKGAQPFLFQLFTQADRDADGKLTRKELIGWLDLVAQGGGAFVSLQVNDQGRGLFQMLDVSADGRLSLRELRGAWERVRPLAKDGGRGLAVADLPRAIRITMGQGNAFGRAVPAIFADSGVPGPRTKGPRGNVPVWFRKMDINNDGDVSPKEWLGTEEDFKRIDTDGDGLISGEEARRYEAKQPRAAEPAKKS